jgi:Ca2+/Na+ antiporter
VVGISAGLRDQGAIALGNVIGSNIANLGLILAICALIRAPHVDRQIVVRLRSVPRLIGAGVPVAPKDLGQRELELVDCKAYPMGHVVLDYRVKR